MAKRPKFQRKADPLFFGGAKPREIACDYALAPFDRRAREMDRRWGVDRLPGLVPSDMAAKYGSALGKLNAAIDAQDVAEIQRRADVCIRGMVAMDKAATDAGHKPAEPQVIEYDLDGWIFGIMPDDRTWQTEQAARPDLRMYTMREVGLALKALEDSGGLFAAAKAIPGAEVVRIGPHGGSEETVEKPEPKVYDDDIPF